LQRQRVGFPRFEFAYREHPTGGLRPPLLFRLRRPSAEIMAIFAMHKRTCTRAAGVSPPWYGEPSAVPRKPHTVQRPCDAGTRAAGVSPPWYGEPNAVPQESRTVQRLCDTEPRAAGVSPPWVSGKRTCRNASAKSPGTAGGVLANAGAVAVANHGGLGPPLLVQCARLPAKNDFCDARTHIRRSAGRQSAVVR
jgi:hypothetical protein